MLQQIISQTPTYVWAILAVLVYRGAAAARDRVVGLRSVFVLPVVMLALGLQALASGFGLVSPAAAAWLIGLAIGACLAWRASAGGVSVNRVAGTVLLRGSWLPMALMLALFAGKFAFAVTLSVQPSLKADLAFALPACAAFGALAGAFLGRPLHVAAALRAAPVGAAQVQAA